jgi:ketosteroid isomerase-like protein
VSQENVELLRRGYERLAITGQFGTGATSDFVWDMSNFHGWPEQERYEGLEGVQTFQDEWTAAWHDWALDVEALYDAGDEVVAVVRQRGRSKASGVPVDMLFAQVWTVLDGKVTGMCMYSDPAEALKAVGPAE